MRERAQARLVEGALHRAAPNGVEAPLPHRARPRQASSRTTPEPSFRVEPSPLLPRPPRRQRHRLEHPQFLARDGLRHIVTRWTPGRERTTSPPVSELPRSDEDTIASMAWRLYAIEQTQSRDNALEPQDPSGITPPSSHSGRRRMRAGGGTKRKTQGKLTRSTCRPSAAVHLSTRPTRS